MAWLISLACSPPVHRSAAHEVIADLQRLLAGVGLADQHVAERDAEVAGVARVERVLRVDEGANASSALHLGDGVQGQRGLARGLRPVDLDEPPAREATDAQREVQRERPRGEGLYLRGVRRVTQGHDGPLAELLLDGGHRRSDGPKLLRRLSHDSLLRASRRYEAPAEARDPWPRQRRLLAG